MLTGKINKNELENCILPFIPKNKRGFSSKFNSLDIFICIVHKLKIGCQWNSIFIDLNENSRIETKLSGIWNRYQNSVDKKIIERKVNVRHILVVLQLPTQFTNRTIDQN